VWEAEEAGGSDEEKKTGSLGSLYSWREEEAIVPLERACLPLCGLYSLTLQEGGIRRLEVEPYKLSAEEIVWASDVWAEEEPL